VDAVATCLNVVIKKKAHHNLSRCRLESEQGLRNKKHEKYGRVSIKIHATNN